VLFSLKIIYYIIGAAELLRNYHTPLTNLEWSMM